MISQSEKVDLSREKNQARLQWFYTKAQHNIAQATNLKLDTQSLLKIEHLKLLWGKQFSKTFLLNKNDHLCVKKKYRYTKTLYSSTHVKTDSL